MCLINYILCFLKASIILNVKVVPNDIFKFGGERVKPCQKLLHKHSKYKCTQPLNKTLFVELPFIQAEILPVKRE